MATGRTSDDALALAKTLKELGVDPLKLAALWPEIVKGLDERAKAEAESLLVSANSMGLLSLGAYIEKHPPGAMTVAWLVKLAGVPQRSAFAARAAAMKNIEARDFAAELWRARSDLGQSKASFARMLEPEVRKRFGVRVTADRIARFWLQR